MDNKQFIDTLMSKLPQMKKVSAETKAKAEDFTLTINGAAGMVRVKIHGSRKITSIEVSDELLEMNDKQMLQDILVSTVNAAYFEAQKKAEERMIEVIPNNFEFEDFLDI